MEINVNNMEKLTVIMILMITILLAQVNCTAAEKEIYVSPDGKASNSGTKTSPLSFEAALSAASNLLKEEGLPEKGLKITLLDGHYPFTSAYTLGKEFAGIEKSPIIIKAEDAAKVVFDGSAQISPDGFDNITDPAERKKLATCAVDSIIAKTITDPVIIKLFSDQIVLTLSYDDKVYLPSVFPNKGYEELKRKFVVPEVSPPAVPEDRPKGSGPRAGLPPWTVPGKPHAWKGDLSDPRGAQVGFKNEVQMAGTWQQWESEINSNNSRNLLTGYISADWLLESHPVYAANAKDKTIHITQATAYGWKQSRKYFKVIGLLCELDKPGEWHFDTKTNKLYIYPPEAITSETKIGLPMATGFLKLDNTSYVTVIGLNVQNVGSNLVYEIHGGRHNLIAGCTIRNSTASGLRISGKYNGAKGCDLIDLDVHVHLNGGVRSPTEITPAHNYVENCHIYQDGFSHQRVNVYVNGVGNIFRNNLVHNSLGQPIDIAGNDHLLELNEVFNVGYDEGDGGAMYSGADMAGYGNVYQHNFIHHLMHVPGKVFRAGIYLDDMQAGGICIGNVFFKAAARAIYMNGGAGHTILDNVFLEGELGAYDTQSKAKKVYNWYKEIKADPNHDFKYTKENYIGRTERSVGKGAWNKSPWKNKYPLFHKIMNDEGEFGRCWPIYCRFEGNLYYGNTRENYTFLNFGPEVMAKTVRKGDGLVKPEDFMDYDNLDLRFKGGKPNLPKIPFENIGLYLDSYRKTMPKKEHYRKMIKQFYDGIPSMPGTTKQIDTAKVVETGPTVSGYNKNTIPNTSTKEPDKRLHSGGGQWGFKQAVSNDIKPLRILLIGDSVMNGYRHQVAEELADAVNCDLWLTPAHLNSKGLHDNLRQVVSEKTYDIIHFNIGLHGWVEGRIPEGQYETLLRQYVDILKKNARNSDLIWASTTPIMTQDTPRALDPINNPTIVKRNKIAEKVMKAKKIPIHDLYSVVSDKLHLGGDKFHWNAEGKRLQAESVVQSIKNLLNANVPDYIWPETFAYKTVGNQELLLDVYKSASDKKIPVFIMVHGGAWVAGRRNSGSERLIGQRLSKEGIAVVSIDYRLMHGDVSNITTGTYDRAMDDLLSAYQWVLENADKHNFDVERIGIGGSSAGGHLSSVFVQQHGKIKYYVGLCGQYDLYDKGQSRFPSISHQENYGIKGPDAQKKASAVYNVRKNPPITLLMHGTTDEVIDYQLALRFGEALEANDGRVKIELFEELGHGFFSTSLNTNHSGLDVMCAFLKEVMLN